MILSTCLKSSWFLDSSTLSPISQLSSKSWQPLRIKREELLQSNSTNFTFRLISLRRPLKKSTRLPKTAPMSTDLFWKEHDGILLEDMSSNQGQKKCSQWFQWSIARPCHYQLKEKKTKLSINALPIKLKKETQRTSSQPNWRQDTHLESGF